MQRPSELVASDEEALEEIARIRRNGFNPGDTLVNETIRDSGPKGALDIMWLAAFGDRKLFGEVH